MIREDWTLMQLASAIYPICRSITGNGVRDTLELLRGYCPELTIQEVPCETQVFDWRIPAEWNIEEAYIEDEEGKRIIDFQWNNLHVIGYSAPMDEWLDYDELKNYVFTLPNQPDWIPYITSYYKRRSGFCMSQKEWDQLDQTGKYHAVIKSTFNEKGTLTYGEILIPGKKKEEIFLSTYICHPSMGNNECSGPCVLIKVACELLSKTQREYSYRIVFVPETIGAITYLARHLEYMKKNVIAGYVVTCVGDDMEYSMVHSRYGNTLSERVLKNVLENTVPHYREYSFLERGSDERQYCAPGVDLPVCTFCRTKFGEYAEYHTSADNLDFISEAGMQGAVEIILKCSIVIERNKRYCVKYLCEPQLGKRNLYPSLSRKEAYKDTDKLLNVLAYADGYNDLIAISALIGGGIS